MTKSYHLIQVQQGDALIIVDVQSDFLPQGSLAVPEGDKIIPVLNDYIANFSAKGLPIYATRDWHPKQHCSFKARGGRWPPHCIANTAGADFAKELQLNDQVEIISKATTPDVDAYSGFENTDLRQRLMNSAVKRIFVGGLATDYCVFNTVKDALNAKFEVCVIEAAIKAVNVDPGDGERALHEMQRLGARLI